MLVVALLAGLHVANAAAPVSVSSYGPYIDQRDCVKQCLWHTSATDDLIVAVGCSSPWVNECYCQSEQANTASSFLSSCVASRCSTPSTSPIITSALVVYDDYCSSVGFPIPTVASLLAYPAYQSQPDCVQLCLWHPGQIVDDLMPAIGCGQPWDNECLCSASLATKASVFLSTCVASRCSAGTDAPQVTSALSVYDEYCSDAGLALPVVVTSLGTSSTGTVAGPTSSPNNQGGSSGEFRILAQDEY
jgi:hypothetical protein